MRYGAYKIIKNSRNIYFRTLKHPVISELEIKEEEYKSFDYLYETMDDFEKVYTSIVDILIEEVQKKLDITYAVPGNPKVAEKSVEYLFLDERIDKLNIELEITPSSSFLEDMFVYLNIDPIKNNLLILDALNFKNEHMLNVDILFTQVYSKHIASELKLKIGKYLKDESKIIIFKGAGIRELEQKIIVDLSEMDKCGFEFDHLTSVFIEYNKDNYRFRRIDDLVEIIARLRGENGCPWDKAQNSISIIKHMREELEELISAIENDDIDNILEEIGDLLMLLVMQARFAEEEYLFDFNEVIEKICSKLVFRHPHVFNGEIAKDIEAVNKIWARQKRLENDNFV